MTALILTLMCPKLSALCVRASKATEMPTLSVTCWLVSLAAQPSRWAARQHLSLFFVWQKLDVIFKAEDALSHQDPQDIKLFFAKF